MSTPAKKAAAAPKKVAEPKPAKAEQAPIEELAGDPVPSATDPAAAEVSLDPAPVDPDGDLINVAGGELIVAEALAAPLLVVPAGELVERLAWVRDGEDYDTRVERADAVYAHEKDSLGADFTGEVDASLSSRLRIAVYHEDLDDEPESVVEEVLIEPVVAEVRSSTVAHALRGPSYADLNPAG